MLVKQLIELEFDIGALPHDIGNSIELLSQLTEGTFNTSASQKVEVLDKTIFESIAAVMPNDEKVQAVKTNLQEAEKKINNDSFNTTGIDDSTVVVSESRQENVNDGGEAGSVTIPVKVKTPEGEKTVEVNESLSADEIKNVVASHHSDWTEFSCKDISVKRTPSDSKMNTGGEAVIEKPQKTKTSDLLAAREKVIHTPEFKHWFGDWENSPHTASKMVDDKGMPLVCFHGTNQEFHEFRDDVGHWHDRGYYGNGFYFTFQREEKNFRYAYGEAEYYGRRIIPVYLNVRNPFDFSILSQYKGHSVNYIGTESFVFLYNIARMFPHLSSEIFLHKRTWQGDTAEITKVPISELPDLIDKYARELKTYIREDDDGRKYMNGYVKSETVTYTDKEGKEHSYQRDETLSPRGYDVASYEKELIELFLITEALEKYDGLEAKYYPEGYMTRNPQITDAIKEKHDGIIQSYWGDEVVVFSPTQIKLADGSNTTFDAGNPDIRMSAGGELPSLNSNGGYEYEGKAKEKAEKAGLITLRKKINGTNCSNCIFQRKGFCDHEEVLLPVTKRMCCAYWDDKTLVSVFRNIAKAEFFPDKEKSTAKLNAWGGYDYSGKERERAEKADLITLPPDVEGTNCAVSNCTKYARKQDGSILCIHPKIKLPVTKQMTCAWWDNYNVKRKWGKPVELTFNAGGEMLSKGGEAKRIQDAIWHVERAPSARLDVVFADESRRYPQTGKPNSFDVSESKGTMTGGRKWSAKNIVAYDEHGKIVGILSISQTEPVGAFKISVREDARRQGWASKLFDKAEAEGFDMVSIMRVNHFSPSGREMAKRWLEKKLTPKKKNGGELSELFNDWFNGSKVVDKEGNPLVVYHGTDKKIPFIGEIKGDIGIHFGTRKASEDRLFNIGIEDGDISAYHLSIKNPIRMRDVGAWADFKDVADELLKNGIISKDEYATAEAFAKTQTLASGREHKVLVDILKSKGYDGIIYNNTSEDIGSDSYIVFDTSQIREAPFNYQSNGFTFGTSNFSDDHKKVYEFVCGMLQDETASPEEKSEKIVELFDRELLPHFQKEEKEVFSVRMDEQSHELYNEHLHIYQLIDKIREEKNIEDINQFCNLLKHHIEEEEKYFAEQPA